MLGVLIKIIILSAKKDIHILRKVFKNICFGTKSQRVTFLDAGI